MFGEIRDMRFLQLDPQNMFCEDRDMRFLQLGRHISSAKVRLRLKKKEQKLRVAGLIAGYAHALCSK